MTTEATEALDQTTDQLDDEDAALAESFAQHSGTPTEPASTPAAEPAPVETAAEVFAREAEGAPAEPAPQESAQPAQAVLESMSDAEINTLKKRLGLETMDSLKQGLDKLAGRFGEVNRFIQQLRKSDADTPEGAAAHRAAEKLERKLSMQTLRERGYEDVAEAVEADLAHLVGSIAPKQDSAEVEALRKQVQKQELRELNRAHPQWQKDIFATDEAGKFVVNDQNERQFSPVFAEWMATKPEDFRAKFLGAWDADFVSEGMTEFKQFRESKAPASAAPAASPAPAAPASRAASKQARLAAAVVPVGSPAAPAGTPQIDEDADFAAGFTAVRSGSG